MTTWKELLRLSAALPRNWTLVGAQMVALHGFEHGRAILRHSLDLDILVNVRNLLGAILLKCHAVGVSDSPNDQLKDVAFLLSLAGNPRELATQLGRGERGVLQRRQELLDPDHPAWMGIPNPEDGRITLRSLMA